MGTERVPGGAKMGSERVPGHIWAPESARANMGTERVPEQLWEQKGCARLHNH